MTQLLAAGTILLEIGDQAQKARVPDTFQLGAISWYCAFLAGRKVSNLRVFNGSGYSDSPRLHHL
jgi:hypothetical protein